MYFEIDDDRPDIAPIGSALSWRTRALGSLATHVAAILLVLLAGRVATQVSVAPILPVVEPREPQDDRRIVFVEPRRDVLSPTPPSLPAPLSDEHRLPRTIERPPDASNPQPFSQGETRELTERRVEEPSRAAGQPDAPAPESTQAAATPAPPAPETRAAQPLPESQSARVQAPPQGAPSAARGGQSLPRGSLGDSLRNLDRYVQREQFDNPRGGQAPFGPAIQFETYGIDFGRWIARFKAQVEWNWIPLIPQAVMFLQGRVAITFNVHKDGRITDVVTAGPSSVQGFNTAARGAIVASNPTLPLPPEYPVEKAFFTVTFYYNERPPD
jgi:TonB family protein